MAQITGGVVKYGRTVKTGDFENKRCDVELSFNVGDAEKHEAILQSTGCSAMSKVHELLGLKTPVVVVEVKTMDERKAEVAAAPAEKEKPKTRTKADLAAERGVKTPDKPPSDPAAMDVVQDQAKAAAENEARVMSGEAPVDPAAVTDDDLMKPTAADVTDAELTSEISRTNGKIKNPVAIRKLIGEYVKAPGQAKDIAQDRRTEFLEKLRAL